MNRIYILGVFLFGLLLASVSLADDTAVKTLTSTEQALAEAPRYRETITSTQNGQTTKVVIEHVAPDRWHIVPPQGPEIIAIGDDTYMKMGDAWQKAPAGVNFSSILKNFTRTATSEEIAKDVTSLTKVGTQTLDKTPTVIYQVVSNIQGLKNTSKIWIGQRDNLPYRLESTSEVPQQKGEVTATVVYDYSANIKIEAPKSE